MYILAKIDAGAGEFERRVQFRGYLSQQCIAGATLQLYRTDTRICARLEDVWVSEGERRKGYGTQLMHEVFAYLEHLAIRREQRLHLQFTCRPQRVAANHLYRALGCTLIATAEGSAGTNLYQKVFCPPVHLKLQGSRAMVERVRTGGLA